MAITTDRWYVGIDSATEALQECVLDAERSVCGDRSIPHSGTGLFEVVAWLRRLTGDRSSAAQVAIEVPRGGVVETLLGAGLTVTPCSRKQLDRLRERVTVAGARDDRRDAWVLASAVRTDPHCVRPIALEDPRILQLRERSRVEDDLRAEANRLMNRAHEQLHRDYPALLTLCPAMDQPWAWALWTLIPTPAAAQRIRPAKVTALLRAHRIRRVDATAVLTTVRAPAMQVAPGTTEAAMAHLELLVPRLRLVAPQREACAKATAALREVLDGDDDATGYDGDGPARPSDVRMLRSLPGVGRIVAATLRGVADRWLRILMAMLDAGTLYDSHRGRTTPAPA